VNWTLNTHLRTSNQGTRRSQEQELQYRQEEPLSAVEGNTPAYTSVPTKHPTHPDAFHTQLPNTQLTLHPYHPYPLLCWDQRTPHAWNQCAGGPFSSKVRSLMHVSAAPGTRARLKGSPAHHLMHQEEGKPGCSAATISRYHSPLDQTQRQGHRHRQAKSSSSACRCRCPCLCMCM